MRRVNPNFPTTRVQPSRSRVQQRPTRESPPPVEYRVLVVGSANAGKTSILQRVSDTIESPEVYKLGPSGTRERIQLNPTMERGEHNIEDELVFANHHGYIFHDSRGFEAGSDDELRIVQDFVRRKSQERRPKDKLHAIWYCIPMDNNRPSLDTRHFEDICPDRTVPVIAVFTKFDQFKLDLSFKLEDKGRNPEEELDDEAERIFRQYYLAGLRGSPPYIRLEKMHKPRQRCTDLIEMTANEAHSPPTQPFRR